MSNWELKKLQRLKTTPKQPAKVSKKMDDFISWPQEDTPAASSCATADETTLSFLASEMRAICVSTQNIEQDIK